MSGVVELGPRAKEFVTKCVELNPGLFISCWSVAAACALTTCVISARHYASLKTRAPISLQRSYYVIFTGFAPLYAVTALMTMLCPRVYLLSFLAQFTSEAYVLSTFGTVMFMLVAHESRVHQANQPLEEGRPNLARCIISALAEQGPKKHWGVPPFGCCFIPLMQPFHLRPQHLRIISFLIRQSVYCQGICAPLMIWSLLTLPPSDNVKVAHAFNVITKISAFLAIYGLVVMYKCTHSLLDHWNTTRKFVALKLIIGICALQDFVVSKIVQAEANEFLTRGSCLLLEHTEGSEKFAIVEHFWTQFFITIETVVLSLLVMRAFPPEEVKDFREIVPRSLGNGPVEAHLDLVEVELAQLDREEALRGGCQ